MDRKITILSDQFEAEGSQVPVEGVTVIIDGMLRQVVDVMIARKPEYSNTVDVIQDALMRGLESIRNEIKP
jgi:hypothetical protein